MNTATHSGRASTFSSLRHPPARWYFGGLIISNVGTWMQSTALAWLVLKTLDGGGRGLGINAALQTLPLIFITPYAGVMADRWNKRRIVFITQAAAGVLAAALAVIDFADAETLLVIQVLSFSQGVIFGFDAPPRRSLIGELVPPNELPNAMSLNTACITGARVLGPAIAGLLITSVGTAWCFAINAVSYVAVLIGITFMRPDPTLVSRSSAAGAAQLVEGFTYIWRTPVLRVTLVVLAVVAAFAFNQQVTVPLLVTGTFDEGAKTFGFLLTAMSAGSLAGSLGVARQRHRLPLAMWLAAAMGVANLAFGFAPRLWITFAVAPLLGAASSGFVAVTSGILTSNADPKFRGRVLAMQTTAFLGVAPLGSPLVGALADATSPRWGFALAGAVSLCVAVVVTSRLARRPLSSGVAEDRMSDAALVTPPAAG